MRAEKILTLKSRVEEALGMEIKKRERFPALETIPVHEEELRTFLASRIDHVLLKPAARRQDLEEVCREAREWKFFSVIVNPYYVALCNKLLEGSGVLTGVAIGFPLGQNKPEVKAREARFAFQEGAREADMVLNVAALKNGDWKLVYSDIRGVVEEMSPCVVKVVLENCYLTEEEKIVGCLIAQAAGAHFVKTSTGFGPSGATVEDVALMREVVGSSLGVKAAGGIGSREVALRMIASGANRLGTSQGVAIVRGEA
ncbi:MAG: deoxyribose-phosphate aldolase [Candidatus Atribacteria bacterium]|nr:deoxyribose-phosphate aldolase [Candidatus Atribacteria bacterium]